MKPFVASALGAVLSIVLAGGLLIFDAWVITVIWGWYLQGWLGGITLAQAFAVSLLLNTATYHLDGHKAISNKSVKRMAFMPVLALLWAVIMRGIL